MLQWPRQLWTVISNQLWWSPCFCTDMQLWRGSASYCFLLIWARNVWINLLALQKGRRAGSWKPSRTMIQYLLLWRENSWHSPLMFCIHHNDALTPSRFLSSFDRKYAPQEHWEENHDNKQLIALPSGPTRFGLTQVSIKAFLWVPLGNEELKSVSFISCLTLVRTMQSAAPLRKTTEFFFFSSGPSEARPMQQLPTRHDADVLFQLK